MGIIKSFIKRWLDILPAQDSTIMVQEQSSFETNVLKNRILYRGDPSELDQIFHQLATDPVTQSRFWASSPSKGLNIRKIHSGLPGMIVNSLADIVVTDMLDVEFKDIKNQGGLKSEWENIKAENDFSHLVTKAIQEVLVAGDGAFKISYDTSISDYPIIEFHSGEFVEYTYIRNRLVEVKFYSRYSKDKKQYTLVEAYGKGYVRYQLLNSSNEEVPLSIIDELSSLPPVSWNSDEILAVPFVVYPSPKWEHRGRSIFDLKTDSFDALDETISQWQDSVRLGRIKRYIPESMIPRDPRTGETMPVNPLDNQFTALSDPLTENGESRIVTEQPSIQYDSYLSTYINNLDMCMQGIISPSTLGIDTKKMDNAEAQREKEKTTLYTRGKIIAALQEVLPKVVELALQAKQLYEQKTPEKVVCNFEFGEYANPSFEAQVDSISRAASSSIMSIESQVEALWGDTKDDTWKEDEVRRIKEQRGLIEMEEPEYIPHGFREEELIANGLDRPTDNHADLNGARNVQVDEAKPETASERRGKRGTKVDTMASLTDGEPQKG